MAREVKVTIVGDVSRFEAALGRADRGLDRLGTSARRAQQVLATALAGGALISGADKLISTFAQYDTALREVGAVSGASAAQLQKMGEIARTTGLQTGVGATSATQAMGELAKAGLSVGQVGPALKGTLALAQAGSLGAAEAASAAANAMQTFGLRAQDTGRVADAFANAANLTTADVGHFAQALEQGGAAAKLVGLDFKNTTLILTELARIGIKGSDAGTSLKSAFLQIANPTKKAAAAMEDYHLSFFKGNGKVKDAADISEMLRKRLGGLNQQQRTAVLQTIAGTDGFRTFAAMMRVSGKESDELMKQLTRQGSAAETAAKKNAGFEGSMRKLKAAAQELGISLGDEFAPDIARFADKLTKLAADPAFKSEFVATFRSGVNVTKDFIDTMKPAVAIVGDAVDFFAKLPGPVKETAIQLGALSLVASRLQGPLGLVGASGAVGKLRNELRSVPADARKAQAALATTQVAATRTATAGRPGSARNPFLMPAASAADLSGAARTDAVLFRRQQAAAQRLADQELARQRSFNARVQRLRESTLSKLSANRRGLAGGAALGGLGGGLLSDGDPVQGALSGAALGSAGGPLGAAAGALAGAGVTALVKAFKGADAERAKKAAADFARRVAGDTDAALATGLRPNDARLAADATARLNAGRQAVAEYRRGSQLIRTGDTQSEANRGADLQREARRRAQAAQLDLDALLKGDSNNFKRAGEQALAAFRSGLASSKGKPGKASWTFQDFRALLADAPREAQQKGADSMIRFAREMEKGGNLPKGSVRRLVKALGREFDGLTPMVGKTVADTSRQVDRGINFEKIVRDANVFVGRVSDQFSGLPRVVVRSLPGAAAALRDQLDRLGAIIENDDPSTKLYKAAKRSLPRVRQEYRTVLRALGSQMGGSEKDAESWARRTASAARRAGSGATDVNKLRDAVDKLNAKLLDGETAARRVERAWRDAGASAKLAEAAGSAVGGITDFSTGLFDANKKRRGGLIRRYATGGLVPAMVSSGEEIEYGGRSMIVPGPRVAADNVPMMLPAGAKVWTEDSQIKRSLGIPVDVNNQVPHFSRGGFVSTAYGPPWNSMNGSGITATGVKLAKGPTGKPGPYIVAVDPSVIPLHSKLGIWPNPFNYRGKFSAEDTGGAIKGNRIDFLDMISRKHQLAWGRRPVSIDTPTKAGSKGYGGGSSGTSVTYKEALKYGRSRTRGGLLPDAFSAGIDAVSTFGSLSSARRYGNPALPQISEALASQEYTKDVTVNMPGVTGGSAAARRAAAAAGAGTTTIDGKPVANWIAKILLRARDAGVSFRVSSGWRSYAEQKRIYDSGVRPAAKPGTSNHEGSKYPRGAVDIADSQAPLRAWLTRNGNPLKWYGPGDRYHFSATGHRQGGVVGFARGGQVRNGATNALQALWEASREFYPGAGAKMPPNLFPKKGSEADLFVGMAYSPGGSRKGRTLVWPTWTLADLANPRRRGAQTMGETAIHEWAHYFQAPAVINSPGEVYSEGGAQAFTRQVAPTVFARLGLPWSVSDRKQDTYLKYASYVTHKLGSQWVRRDQFDDRAAKRYRYPSVKGIRGGGIVGRYATGGRVAGGGSWLTAPGFGRVQLTAPDRMPPVSLRSPLAAVRKGAGPDQLKALDDAIGLASEARIEKLRGDLLKDIRRGGDKRTVARLQAAVSVIEAEIGGRLQQRLQSVMGEGGFLAGLDKAKAKRMLHLQLEGLDESSVGGLGVTASSAADFLAGYGKSRASLVKAREDAKRLMRSTKSPEALRSLAAKADEARQALAELDERRDQALVDRATAARELPRAQAAERLSGYDLEAALAALTADPADDADVLRRRSAATREELDKAIARKDTAAQLDLATQLKGLQDAVEANTQELRDSEQARMDLDKQKLDQEAKLLHAIQTQASALPAALAAFANVGVGTTSLAGLGTSFIPGVKWRS
ncbi:phage tail tape measure protein [Patulibacter defluvii]|uniref:phage tail tape measure protein n=1 Tax=Patulibacter defluvii TaxID=3095358 RepID=UPI002A747422|nr:phage tail tape measure protein [Patulibacter sp. DM4]